MLLEPAMAVISEDGLLVFTVKFIRKRILGKLVYCNRAFYFIANMRIWYDSVIFPVIGPSVFSAANQNA